MRRLERIQWRAGRICFGLIRSTHVLSVKVLAGVPPIRQMLSFLNERFLVSALAKPNNFFMVKLDELHRIWNNSNCLPDGRFSARVGWYQGRTFLRSSTSTWWI
jgi:hypothetical protein